ncbi:MAG: hypothetical protein KF736_01810 [Acidobacteria bacterium]|nr:hypothetical protein [Acidobacteriota bacterium]MCW5948213.1 hypothetical protein [Pyrinomonadaceae bacterium]
MKLTLLSLTLLLSLVGLSYGQDGVPRKFTSKSEGFSVVVPCNFSVRREADPTNNTSSVEHSCLADESLYLVRKDIGLPILNTKESFDAFTRGVVEGMEGTLLRQSEITLGKIVGRELLVETEINGDKIVFKMRILTTENGVLTYGGGRRKANEDLSPIDKFLDSFSIE